MSNTVLYGTVTGCTHVESVTINTGHDSAVTIALIECENTTAKIGDEITINLGYTDDHAVVFVGYIKQIEKKAPSNTYSITAHDTMSRAIDYFIASSDPNNPFKRRDISAEDLVHDVIALSGLTHFNLQPTSFTLAIGTDATVNLISAYDYASSIADIVCWHLYANNVTGVINFVNRKPYVMYGTSGQPGDIADVSIGTITIDKILTISHKMDEVNTRNRVVVYGKDTVHAEAKALLTYDPLIDDTLSGLGYYKTVVFASPLLTSTHYAQMSCDYNLNMLNRWGHEINITILGNHNYIARKVITLDFTFSDGESMSKKWYIYSSELNWSRNGFVNNMILRI